MRYRKVFDQVVAGAEYCRVQRRHDPFKLTAHQQRETFGRLDHYIQKKLAAHQPNLAFLPLQFLQCLLDPAHRALAYAAALMQHSVYGRDAGACL